tara:strand:+ start:1054 stop:2340 length:1287 start_codon:yes stop_codon:yes gene_type:complete
MKKKIIIIGGGLTGILISKFLNKEKFDVTLVESSKNLGGYLSSIKHNKYNFDFGTHFLRETGKKDIDKILFNKIRLKWHKFKVIPSGCYYNNNLINSNQFIDLRYNKKYQKILNEILNNKRLKFNFRSELERCLYDFGNTITKDIIEPIIFKYCNLKLKNIKPYTIDKFALARYVLASNENTISLKKKNRFYDKVIAYNSFNNGNAGLYNFYPKNGGIEKFKNFFLDKNIKIIKGQKIVKIDFLKNRIRNLVLDNKKISADYIFSTVPLHKISVKKKDKEIKRKNSFIDWGTTNILSNKKFKTDCYYINIHDPKTNAYRITFYDNIQDTKTKKKYRATIEFVGYKNKKVSNKIINDLLFKTKLIDRDFKIEVLSFFKTKLPFGIEKNKFKNVSNLKIINNSLFNGISQEDNIVKIYNSIKIFNEKNYN